MTRNELARWESAELTYETPGATRDEVLPAGYDHLDIEERSAGAGPRSSAPPRAS